MASTRSRLAGRARCSAPVAVACALLLAVSCSTPPPIAPPPTGPLAIPSGDLPVMLIGQAYSFQLQATGATGTVHWSVTSGSLPPGITLTDGGMLAGTIPNQVPPIPNGFVSLFLQVEAIDDTGTASRLLAPLILDPSIVDGGIRTSNAPLPDGTQVLVGVSADGIAPAPCSPCGTWLGRYEADGSLSHVSTFGIQDLAGLSPVDLVTRDATRALMSSATSVSIVDAVTGATVRTIPVPAGFTLNFPSISPDGTYVMMTSAPGVDPGGETRIFRASDGSFVRSVPISGTTVWSPDSTAFFFTSGIPIANDGSIEVKSPESPSGDRTLPSPAPGASCLPVDWSVTNRILSLCSLGYLQTLITLSGIDGADHHVILPFPTQGPSLPWLLNGGFSPSGTHVVFGLATAHFPGPAHLTDATLMMAPDADGPALSELADLTDDGFVVGSVPAAWR